MRLRLRLIEGTLRSMELHAGTVRSGIKILCATRSFIYLLHMYSLVKRYLLRFC